MNISTDMEAIYTTWMLVSIWSGVNDGSGGSGSGVAVTVKHANQLATNQTLQNISARQSADKEIEIYTHSLSDGICGRTTESKV